MKDIETVAVAISIAAGCEPCTKYHIKQARKLGATDVELLHMAATAGSAWNESNAWTLAVNEIISMPSSEDASAHLARHGALARVGISVCRNGVRPLHASIEMAREQGVTDEQIMEVIELAARIKEKAASHLDRVIDRLDAGPGIGREAASLCR